MSAAGSCASAFDSISCMFPILIGRIQLWRQSLALPNELSAAHCANTAERCTNSDHGEFLEGVPTRPPQAHVNSQSSDPQTGWVPWWILRNSRCMNGSSFNFGQIIVANWFFCGNKPTKPSSKHPTQKVRAMNASLFACPGKYIT